MLCALFLNFSTQQCTTKRFMNVLVPEDYCSLLLLVKRSILLSELTDLRESRLLWDARASSVRMLKRILRQFYTRALVVCNNSKQ
jgi:hypothetical protein